MPAPERVSLRSIGQKLKISTSTVSRALRNQPGVSAEVREKVLRTAEKLGYRPDPALGALSALRWSPGAKNPLPFAVACIHVVGKPADEDQRPSRSKRGASRTDSLRRRCEDFGMVYDEFWLENYENSQALGRILLERGFHGLVFSIEGPTERWGFPFEKFSCVGIGYETPEHSLHRVCGDYAAAIHMAVKEAAARGYRRIGFLQFLHSNPEADIKIGAAIELCRSRWQREVGPQPEVFVYPTDGNYTKLFLRYRSSFHRWREREKPDVLIDANTLGLWWLDTAGYSLPEHYGYISILETGPNPLEQQVCRVDPRYDLQGLWAADLLVSHIQMGLRGLTKDSVRIVVPCAWHEATSLRPRMRAVEVVS